MMENDNATQFVASILKDIPPSPVLIDIKSEQIAIRVSDNCIVSPEFSLPNLKPTTQSISLRLPISLLESIKVAANSRDVPYQSLIKIWLNEKLHEVH